MNRQEFERNIINYLQHFEPINPYLNHKSFDDFKRTYLLLYDVLGDREKLQKQFESTINNVDDPDLTKEFMDYVHDGDSLYYEFQCCISLMIDAYVVRQTEEINGKIYAPYADNRAAGDSARRLADAIYNMLNS